MPEPAYGSLRYAILALYKKYVGAWHTVSGSEPAGGDHAAGVGFMFHGAIN